MPRDVEEFVAIAVVKIHYIEWVFDSAVHTRSILRSSEKGGLLVPKALVANSPGLIPLFSVGRVVPAFVDALLFSVHKPPYATCMYRLTGGRSGFLCSCFL